MLCRDCKAFFVYIGHAGACPKSSTKKRGSPSTEVSNGYSSSCFFHFNLLACRGLVLPVLLSASLPPNPPFFFSSRRSCMGDQFYRAYTGRGEHDGLVPCRFRGNGENLVILQFTFCPIPFFSSSPCPLPLLPHYHILSFFLLSSLCVCIYECTCYVRVSLSLPSPLLCRLEPRPFCRLL